MKATLVWWDLTESEQTIDTLREYLRDEGVQPWESVRGLRMKCWIANRAANRWGAFEVWSEDADPASLPPARASELIGYRPTERMRFDVEAAVDGPAAKVVEV